MNRKLEESIAKIRAKFNNYRNWLDFIRELEQTEKFYDDNQQRYLATLVEKELFFPFKTFIKQNRPGNNKDKP